ncbi:MAG TPA: hypothetical protein VK001_00875 [Geminicoccaceae bacterium]|nr:hypothetical protein [Geminicoccaceae bacterium]
MPLDGAPAGWDWFAAGEPAPAGGEDLELCRAFARCFAGGAGQSVLEHLRRTVLERRLPPSASDAELRHLEGQRSAVAYILAMVERGSA